MRPVRKGRLFLPLLLLAAAYPVHAAFEKHPARALKYGLFLGLVFTFFLGVGSELMFYDQLLPGMGSLIRRFAVPCMATPLVGALFSHLFALPRRAPHQSAPVPPSPYDAAHTQPPPTCGYSPAAFFSAPQAGGAVPHCPAVLPSTSLRQQTRRCAPPLSDPARRQGTSCARPVYMRRSSCSIP